MENAIKPAPQAGSVRRESAACFAPQAPRLVQTNASIYKAIANIVDDVDSVVRPVSPANKASVALPVNHQKSSVLDVAQI